MAAEVRSLGLEARRIGEVNRTIELERTSVTELRQLSEASCRGRGSLT